MADVTKINGYIIKDANAPHPSNAGSAGQVLKKTETGTEWADASFKPEGKSYLTFSSPNSFTLKVNDTTKHWEGTLEYFSSNRTWTVWDGTTTLSAVADDGEYVLYLRGTGNTVITGNDENYRWVLTGTDISCVGNIENLLDYATVESGNHPTMADSCYYSMFYGCTSLTQAPALPATTLATQCYYSMFAYCTALTQAPALPATTLAESCYYSMFYNCTALTQAPALPATTLATQCYYSMFYNCTSLIQAPALPATTLATYCYYSMFQGCTSLTQAPALPATTLAMQCYYSMFSRCTSLTKAPVLPATTLTPYCYTLMFFGCTGLTQAPALPATTLAIYCYQNMFKGCTNIKLSSTKTGEYTQEYCIPSSGTGTTAKAALTDMFTSTGGTFTGTPEINTTYYLSSDNMIVRDTEIATLNGYVGSMIKDKLDKTGDGSNVTAAFTAATARANIATGEKLSVLFGKIAKWFSDLGSLAFKSSVAKTDLAQTVQDALVPSDGTTGQVLTKTASGQAWADAPKTVTIPETTALLKGDGSGGVAAAGSSDYLAGAQTYTATLPNSGWVADGSYLKQTVTVTGLKASYPVSPVVDAQLSGTDAEGDIKILEAFAAINILQTAENQLIAYCLGDLPAANIPLIINTWG